MQNKKDKQDNLDEVYNLRLSRQVRQNLSGNALSVTHYVLFLLICFKSSISTT